MLATLVWCDVANVHVSDLALCMLVDFTIDSSGTGLTIFNPHAIWHPFEW